MYNREKLKDWEILISIIRKSGLYPTAIYWTLGETPGGLARSKLKGLFIIVFAKKKRKKVNVIFRSVLEIASEFMNINEKKENEAYENLMNVIKRFYNNIL